MKIGKLNLSGRRILMSLCGVAVCAVAETVPPFCTVRIVLR